MLSQFLLRRFSKTQLYHSYASRVKGGKRAPAFDIKLEGSLASSGAVFLTASSSNEDAQESDRLKGSFFTHYLVSGLLGSPDQNGDGSVSLSEAYRHAYDSTLRASSRTLAGTQHPTFKYALKGKGDIVLTRPGIASGRAWLELPKDLSYLIMRSGEDGPVDAEVMVSDTNRKISLRPGRYFIRGRARDHLVEGSLELASGQRLALQNSSLTRTDYARLVRKGGGTVLSNVMALEVGGTTRTALGNSRGLCHGLSLGYSVEFPYLDLGVRGHACRSSFTNGELEATADEMGLDLRVGRSWDVPIVTVAPYLQTEPSLLQQRFETPGRAPTRNTVAAHLDAGLALRIDMAWGSYALIDLAAQTYWYDDEERGLGAHVAARGIVALGWRWARHLP